MAKEYRASILSVYDEDRNQISIPAIMGKRAYEYAIEDGYTGSEEDYKKDMNPENIKEETEIFIISELAKREQFKPEFAESVEWLKENGDTTKLYVMNDETDPNYGMIYAYMTIEKEVGSEQLYTNQLSAATDTDRQTIYGEDYDGDGTNDGYLKGVRLSSSGSTTASSVTATTGFIPVKENDVLRIKNPKQPTGTNIYVIAYDSSNVKTGYIQYGPGATSATVEDNGYTTDKVTVTVPLSSAKFGSGFDAVRVSFGVESSDVIITINQEIIEGGSIVITETDWASTGHALIPADYEDRIIELENKTLRHTTEITALQEAIKTGGIDETKDQALKRIREWDKPIYDPAPVTLLADDRIKPALTTEDRTVNAIYAKYRALMAEHPDYITETNMGKSSSSDTFTAVDMLRFDFKEPGGLTSPTSVESARHETKPKIILMSGVHTEWVGVWGLYYALEEITTNPDFDDIRRNAHIIVIPCANPACLAWTTSVDGWRMSHVNANGVAIHNNFGVDHRTNGTVGEYNYGGSAPYSEPETQYIDAVMADNPDAVAFVSCHNYDYSTQYGSPVIWASSATYHMCNVVFRLIDKLSKAWIDKYGQTLKDSIDEYKINMDSNDYRLGTALMSSSAGTEQKNATKYGIMGTNLEISRMMKVFSGNMDGTSEVMTHGAEVYANFMRTLLQNYDHKDKKEYAPNLPWSE